MSTARTSGSLPFRRDSRTDCWDIRFTPAPPVAIGFRALRANGTENFEMALDEIVWLLTLLANQFILIHNLKNTDAPQELLTEEDVELLTSPLDLAAYKNAVTEAMFKGTARNVENESEGGAKNAQGV